MNFRIFILFLIPTLIWGSTWYVIKFQLGLVDPLVSVSWRFLLAGLILMLYCKLRGLNLKFKAKGHGLMLLLGVTLLGLPVGFRFDHCFFGIFEVTWRNWSRPFCLYRFDYAGNSLVNFNIIRRLPVENSRNSRSIIINGRKRISP